MSHSIDLHNYVDLTVYDKDPAEMMAESIEYAQTVLPEFSPVSGSVEDALLQAGVAMAADLKGSINRMTPGLLEVVLQLFDIERNTGTQATGTLAITMIDNLGYTVPAGTRFGFYDNSDPANPILYTFDTDEDLTIPGGQTTGEVTITAVLEQVYPELVDGEPLQLLTPTAFISSAALAEDLDIGSDPESDEEYFSRAVSTLNSYSQCLTLASQFDHYVLATYSDVFRCKTYSRVNPANDDLVDALENGYTTVYASRVGGASLSPAASSAIEEDLENRAVAGLIINVVPPHLVDVDVVTTFTVKSGYVASTVRDAVEEALGEYIDPDHWHWGDTIYYNEVVSLIDQVEGVDLVVTLTLEGVADDFEFTKYGSLPIGAFTVSVT